jgi:hypothetical protein
MDGEAEFIQPRFLWGDRLLAYPANILRQNDTALHYTSRRLCPYTINLARHRKLCVVDSTQNCGAVQI